MIFGSVCAGIEAERTCTKCKVEKPIEEFHRQGKGKRHCWCRSCFNARMRIRVIKPETRRKFLLANRYGLTEEQFQQMVTVQNRLCAICGWYMRRICIDHNHDTGKVRGLLCHGCNIKLAAIENTDYHAAALKYLQEHA